MSWILDHLSFVIVGVLAIGSFLKSRFDAMKQDPEEPEDFSEADYKEKPHRQRPPLTPYVPPRVERTPPAVPVQHAPEQRVVFAATRSQSGAMSASADEAILQQQRDIEERLRAIRAAQSAKGSKKAPIRAQTSARKPAPVAAGVTPSIRSQLRNPAELRRAIVLREILDRPVGLR